MAVPKGQLRMFLTNLLKALFLPNRLGKVEGVFFCISLLIVINLREIAPEVNDPEGSLFSFWSFHIRRLLGLWELCASRL
jgi:hypothetical protein